MDLLLIVRKIWRHKLLTVPVILLTLAGAVYVVVVKEPLYEASTSYLLISPRPPPTAEEIARNPALAKVQADNPYTRFTDQSVVVDVLERRLSTESARRTLMRAGADPRYTVGSGVEFGSAVPIMQITALAVTPEAAIESAKVVGGAAIAELDRMQKEHDVDPGYRITAMRVEDPDGARLKASGHSGCWLACSCWHGPAVHRRLRHRRPRGVAAGAMGSADRPPGAARRAVGR